MCARVADIYSTKTFCKHFSYSQLWLKVMKSAYKMNVLVEYVSTFPNLRLGSIEFRGRTSIMIICCFTHLHNIRQYGPEDYIFPNRRCMLACVERPVPPSDIFEFARSWKVRLAGSPKWSHAWVVVEDGP